MSGSSAEHASPTGLILNRKFSCRWMALFVVESAAARSSAHKSLIAFAAASSSMGSADSGRSVIARATSASASSMSRNDKGSDREGGAEGLINTGVMRDLYDPVVSNKAMRDIAQARQDDDGDDDGEPPPLA